MADELSTTLPCLYLGAVTGNLPSGLPVDNFLDWLFSIPQEMLIVVDIRQFLLPGLSFQHKFEYIYAKT